MIESMIPATASRKAGPGHRGARRGRDTGAASIIRANNDYSRPQYNWARWYPGLTAGSYEVFVYIPGQYATTRQARYWVSHAGGYTLRLINQYAYSNQWVSLGDVSVPGHQSGPTSHYPTSPTRGI